jgi:hypothetical protein
MAKISETELRRKLKKLEVDSSSGSGASVEKVGDQYEYDKSVIYIAYASALSNLSSGTIPSQSDATDFQFSPYNDSGVLLAYRGYFINKSIYQSGDPTDYTWESTSGASGFTSSERYYTTSTGLQNTLGNPTKPGTDVGWTVITAGDAVPGTAVYLAERFTLTTSSGAVTSNWDINPVGKHVDTSVVSASGIKATNMDLDGTLNVTANSGAVRWGKVDGDDVVNSGLFIGRNSSGDPKFVIGSTNSYIYFDGTTVSTVGVSDDDNTGTDEIFYTDTTTTHTWTIGPNIATINIQMVGAGGGGGRNGTSDNSSPGTTAGEASTIVVKQSNGSTRTTFTAAGGANAGAAGSGGGGSFAAGQAGDSFAHPGGSNHASFAGTGGAGGAYNTNNAGADGGTGAGGGGQGQGGSGSAADGGGGGGEATFYSTVYTVVSTTDYLEIDVGAGGSGAHVMSGNTPNVKAGGTGGNGRVRLQGVL